VPLALSFAFPIYWLDAQTWQWSPQNSRGNDR
jgi:hypothetical protein